MPGGFKEFTGQIKLSSRPHRARGVGAVWSAKRRRLDDGLRRPFFSVAGLTAARGVAARQQWVELLAALAPNARRRPAGPPPQKLRFGLTTRARAQIEELRSFCIALERSRRAFLCEAAIVLTAAGVGIPAAANALHVSPSSLWRWLRTYQKVGARGLAGGAEIGWNLKKGMRRERQSPKCALTPGARGLTAVRRDRLQDAGAARMGSGATQQKKTALSQTGEQRSLIQSRQNNSQK
jgi:hypothetical protein